MRNKGTKCSVPTCSKDAICKGYCSKHYQQKRLRGEIIEKDYMYVNGLCKNVGCGKKVFAKGFCQLCYLKDKAHD